jgi:hypothetical protein
MAVYFKRVAQRFVDLGLTCHDPFGELWTSQDLDLGVSFEKVLRRAKKKKKETEKKGSKKKEGEYDVTTSEVWVNGLKARRGVIAKAVNAAAAAASDGAAASGAAGAAASVSIPSLVIARMDVSDESPPSSFNINLASLPSLVIFPAKDKGAPYRFFSGVAKVTLVFFCSMNRLSDIMTLSVSIFSDGLTQGGRDDEVGCIRVYERK